ncbi:MAG: hypothetical protein ABF718_08750, partial [Leuconostoc pseudomesenteroides]
MSEFSALQVVNWFRAQNVADMKTDEMVEPLTQMKAMKLLYYAQGIMLAAYDAQKSINWTIFIQLIRRH